MLSGLVHIALDVGMIPIPWITGEHGSFGVIDIGVQIVHKMRLLTIRLSPLTMAGA